MTTTKEAFRNGFYAAGGVAALLLLLWGLRHLLSAIGVIVTPFAVSIVVALLLDPMVDRVQRRWLRGRRLPAVLLVYALFLVVFGALLAFIVPRLFEQAQNLVSAAPAFVERTQVQVNQWLSTHRHIGPLELPGSVDALVTQYAQQLSDAFKVSIGGVAAIILGSVSRLLSVILIPIITFYLLVDIDRLRARLIFLMPERARESYLQTTALVGGVFGSYLRGMVTICSAYSAAAVIVLLLLGLKSYALLLGVAAGVLYAVPYVGALATVLLTALVASAAGKSAGFVLLIVIVLLVQNQIFDNIVMPRVVGGGVGLHPLIAMFALLLGGNLLGLWGMLLAVPLAASIQAVLYRLYPRLATPTPLVHYRRAEAEALRASRAAAEPPPTEAEVEAGSAAVTPPES